MTWSRVYILSNPGFEGLLKNKTTTLTRTNSREHRPFSGIALRVLSVGYITSNDSIIKWVVNEHPLGQGIFIRGVLVLLLISLLVIRQGVFRILRIHSRRLQLWSLSSNEYRLRVLRRMSFTVRSAALRWRAGVSLILHSCVVTINQILSLRQSD